MRELAGVSAQVDQPIQVSPVARSTTSRIIAWTTLALLTVLIGACASPSSPTDTPRNYEGTVLDRPAADFRLVDQNGATIALSDFRGQVVALTFMDSQCREVCPLTAAHLRAANQMLGDDAASVVFMGVNVNVKANTVADVMAITSKWRLDEIPTWHFLTGSAEELEPVWKAYGVAVAPGQGEIQHTPGVFLIDRSGQQRWYVSTPFDKAGTPQGTAPLSELLVKHIRELLNDK